ncbi:methylmalonyl-CoA mutase family protein [Psychrobacillus sp. OK032]|uniref:methylmalonyl-CoA mutase family protein n=1 Tax=Psychrobacillus sp. OK032 TaxID=1884358 RepID=UPI0008C33F57|nr:methylmalonyl-CoA mutase family protein [Psychrobacillus sp. OK032]SER78848.1 heterodimeric methylmalonyl-CoA mutase small subunit [Psychrobacillus sp. OK032]
MTIDKMRETTFNKATMDEWEQVALKSLKGKTLESLSMKTLEDIILKPLYSLEDVANLPASSQTAIVRQAKNSSEWQVAQVAEGSTSEVILVEITETLSKGNDVIHFTLEKEQTWNASQIEELAALLAKHPAILDVTNDPDFLNHFPDLKGLIKGAGNAELPNARTYFLNGSSIHQAGGDAVSELASVLVQADALARNTSIEELVSKAFVQFSVENNFFMEIAKIRAFRVLWEAFGQSYGNTNIATIPVHTETSLRSYSVLDANVNILRGGNSALAAVLGGADSLTTYPHNYLTGVTPTSNRIARNMQLVLKEETHIGRVIDAAGGSYYVDTLTNGLVEKTWSYFLTLMKEATIEEREAKLLKRAEVKWEEQLTALSTRKKSLIGTNTYANPNDVIGDSIKLTNYKRLAEPFEQLRKAFQESPLNTAIIPYGILKEYKARMDFVSGYLIALGISPIVAPENLKPFDLRKWIAEQGIDYVVFVGNDEQTAGLVPALLNEQLPVPMDIAGKFEEYEDWLDAGLSGCIFAGQSLLEKGQDLLALVKKGDSHVNA